MTAVYGRGTHPLVRTSLATAASAVVGSLATARSIDSRWYEKLDKPGFQPPGWVFPVAWTALYTDIAVTTGLALKALPEAERATLGRALGVNLALNAGWSITFFGTRSVAASVPVAAALALSSADLVRRVGRAKKRYGVALSPYAAWTAFATVLSASLQERNPGE